MLSDRHYIHENAEIGLDLPKTVNFVKLKLAEYGYDNAVEMGGGVVATVGKPGKTILLRADMDALPQTEITGLPYACKTGACHSCGHDVHTAMLLTAARMLKEHEDELQGTVKLMFQPGEEGWGGGKVMIDAGVLEDPKVDAAIGIHQCPHDAGQVRYSKGGTRCAITFNITVHGKSTHGAGPHRGISALSAAAAIVTAAERLPAMEVDNQQSAVLSVCQLICGTADNIIPDKAELAGTIRVFDNSIGTYLVSRLEEIVNDIAKAYRCTAELKTNTIPAFNNCPELCDEIAGYLADICGEENIQLEPGNFPATDDFAYLGLEVPGMYFVIGMSGEGYGPKLSHNPATILNEDGMKYGAAYYAYTAEKWLENHCAD